MNSQLEHLQIRPVTKTEEPRFLECMQLHHYLGALTKIGHTLWYFVDPARYHGAVYRAANWLYLWQTQGYRRTREGDSRA